MPSQTFNITASGDDQFVYKSAASYPPGGSVTRDSTGDLYVQRAFVGSYVVGPTLLKFDTSALPDSSTITAATLRLYVMGRANADTRNLTAGWYTWNNTDSDYTDVAETTALAGTALSSVTLDSDNDFALTGVSNVNTSGATFLRLHISGVSPAGNNYLQIASYDHATFTEPRLIVTYAAGVSYLVGAVHV